MVKKFLTRNPKIGDFFLQLDRIILVVRTRALMKKLYGDEVWENLKP